MASVTATATMAAAGFDKRASAASSLQTPGSGTFPSEMLSPMAASPSFLKKDDLKTPITPPSAYLDFLRNMSPAMMSPASTGTSSRFSFHDKSEKPSDKASEIGSERPSSISPPISLPTSQPPSQPASQPALSRNTSYDSTASTTTNSSDHSAISQASSAGASTARPDSPRVIIPPSPFAKPAPRTSTGRTPRRLHIPQSPFSPALGSAQSTHSVHSVHSMASPYSSTPLSAAPWSASFSPRDIDLEATNKPGKVSVRQVVTRTVTYCRTPLDPAPKGKRRKIDVEEVSSKSSSEEPSIKQEQSETETPTPEPITEAMGDGKAP